MSIPVVKTVIVDFHCSTIFSFEKEKLFTLLQFHIEENGTKGVTQALPQKGRLGHRRPRPWWECGAALAPHSFGRQWLAWDLSSGGLDRMQSVETVLQTQVGRVGRLGPRHSRLTKPSLRTLTLNRNPRYSVSEMMVDQET